MTDRKADKFKTSGVPILANSGPSMEKVYQDFILFVIKIEGHAENLLFCHNKLSQFLLW